MNYYQELTIINNPELSLYELWSKLYMQLHLAFVEQKDANEQVPYGVSFPEYVNKEEDGRNTISLGTKLRIFANNVDEFQALNLDKWLDRLTDYVHIKKPKPVVNVKYFLSVNRYRPKGSVEKLARRQAKHNGISITAATDKLGSYTQKLITYPFIKINSLHDKKSFSLCINQQKVNNSCIGKFNTYGLSKTATVPWF